MSKKLFGSCEGPASGLAALQATMPACCGVCFFVLLEICRLFNFHPRRWQLAIVICLLVVVAGCNRQSTAQRLVGRWVGKPETAQQRQDRSLVANNSPAKTTDDDAAKDSPTEKTTPSNNGPPTELETVDVQVTLDFSVDGTIEMWLGEKQETLAGDWRVISTEVNLVQLQITAKRETQEDAVSKTEKRRFDLQWQELKAGDAFTLREQAADPQFGTLYFVREE